MQKLIKDGQIINDHWQLIGADTLWDQVPLNTEVIVNLSLWLNHKPILVAQETPIGVWLNAEQAIEDLVEDLTLISVIGLDFPTFTDGRHYSTARILREQYHYQGEIRALGEVLVDQLQAMQRCGFNAFMMKENSNIEATLQKFNTFSVSYQGDSVEPLPLFKRRSS